jgi:hypothetical protein
MFVVNTTEEAQGFKTLGNRLELSLPVSSIADP